METPEFVLKASVEGHVRRSRFAGAVPMRVFKYVMLRCCCVLAGRRRSENCECARQFGIDLGIQAPISWIM